jgi:Ni,Fe-hydrogenase III small subunit
MSDGFRAMSEVTNMTIRYFFNRSDVGVVSSTARADANSVTGCAYTPRKTVVENQYRNAPLTRSIRLQFHGV